MVNNMLKPREERNKVAPEDGKNEDYPTVIVEIEDTTNSAREEVLSLLDINDLGMGVTCEFHLQVGQSVKFLKNQTEWDLPEQGVVMWTFKANEGFQAGIKFL